jgi:hypothetical protein
MMAFSLLFHFSFSFLMSFWLNRKEEGKRKKGILLSSFPPPPPFTDEVLFPLPILFFPSIEDRGGKRVVGK